MHYTEDASSLLSDIQSQMRESGLAHHTSSTSSSSSSSSSYAHSSSSSASSSTSSSPSSSSSASHPSSSPSLSSVWASIQQQAQRLPLPSWARIPVGYRRPLAIVWSMVLVLALARMVGLFVHDDDYYDYYDEYPASSRRHRRSSSPRYRSSERSQASSTSQTGRRRHTDGYSSSSVASSAWLWNIGLNLLFPFFPFLMAALFSSIQRLRQPRQA